MNFRLLLATSFAILLWLCGVASAAVTIDAFSVGGTGGWGSGVFNRAADSPIPNVGPSVSVSSGSTFITVGAGATAMVVGLMAASSTHGTDDPGTVTITVNPSGGSQVMTQLGPVVQLGGSQQGPLYLFGLINPTAGAKVIQLAWTNTTNSQEFYIYAMSFKSTGTPRFYGFATAHDPGTPTLFNGVTTSASILSGDMAFSMHINPGPGFFSPATNATGTQMDDDQNVTNNSYGQYFSGSGSAILAEADNDSSFGSVDFWSAAVVAIGEPLAPSSSPSRNLLGVGK